MRSVAMISDLGTDWLVTIKDRVKALRLKLGLTQEELAKRAGWTRVYASKIEQGKNNLSTYDARVALAQAVGLSVPDVIAYLEGSLTLDAAAKKALVVTVAPALPLERPMPFDPAEADSPLEAALAKAFDSDKHSLKELDLVRSILRESHQLQNPDADLLEAAGVWLDGAAQLRREGIPVTERELLVRVTLGRKVTVRTRRNAADAEAEAVEAQKTAAEGHGVPWGSKRDVRDKYEARGAGEAAAKKSD